MLDTRARKPIFHLATRRTPRTGGRFLTRITRRGGLKPIAGDHFSAVPAHNCIALPAKAFGARAKGPGPKKGPDPLQGRTIGFPSVALRPPLRRRAPTRLPLPSCPRHA